MIICNRYETPLGTVSVRAESKTGVWELIGLYFEDMVCTYHKSQNIHLFSAVKQWLDSYFTGKPAPYGIPFTLYGTPFQKSVWNAIQEIPYGATVSYKALAEKLGTHARAVGQATARNPLSIIIPCHRVIGTNGTLVGYGGGLNRKKALLDLEQSFIATPRLQ
ncbi:MAG: methylated-DNA--[protein]-cysteine S-methyltransferase [Treponema sp.]|jgi:methylated-DNA-[protein]-cysteine S-methyltransferase|nr:methylated-DNA--[protein]-cysteine S-methyltransferase [Treponema sp.]